MSLRPTRRSIDVPNGPSLSALDWGGRGPLCLLLHANGFCARTWSMVAAALAHDHHVVALDCRGHGQSARPPAPDGYWIRPCVEDLDAAIDQLQPRADLPLPLLAGHSWGGATALHHAIERPGRAERLLLLDPVILPAEVLVHVRPGYRSPLGIRARRRRAVFDSRDEARRLWSRNAFFKSFHPEVFEDYLRGGLREREDGKVELSCPPEVEAAIFDSPPPDPVPGAPRITANTLIERSERSPFPEAGYTRTVAAIPRCRMETVAAGHLIPMEQPLRVASVIRALVAEPG